MKTATTGDAGIEITRNTHIAGDRLVLAQIAEREVDVALPPHLKKIAEELDIGQIQERMTATVQDPDRINLPVTTKRRPRNHKLKSPPNAQKTSTRAP